MVFPCSARLKAQEMFALGGDLIYRGGNQGYFIWSGAGLLSSETHNSVMLEVLLSRLQPNFHCEPEISIFWNLQAEDNRHKMSISSGA